jgi:hypothetical protein
MQGPKCSRTMLNKIAAVKKNKFTQWFRLEVVFALYSWASNGRALLGHVFEL